jgi:hypothetical protein
LKNFKYRRKQLNENLRDTFTNRTHSQHFTLNWNVTFCEDAKWTHIAQSKDPVAGHYMITNSSSAKCVHCVRYEDVTAMLLMIQFYWHVMQCCRQDVPSILELLYPDDKVITFLLNIWNYSLIDCCHCSGSGNIKLRTGL